ncbi:globin (plasmid) [Gemmatirosa kalamazoonensis]|uniref:Globin n=1 Tax=Gemmatirosa kalamazoonensis TaxID=861299 RepID=W0RSF3_9BACT|nr:group III truncated hemoglobin [Gemmatirosa kalamazoonensis]AHG93220.1 globin [Gemmatirosa kalamazoonensis]
MSRTLPITTKTSDTPEPSATAETSGALPDVDDDVLIPLLTAFYAAIERDDVLRPYFAGLDMATHIPRIADFWSTVLLLSRRYQGNAFRPHLEMPGLSAGHFRRWLATLEATIDARHAGPVAEQMKTLGHRIAHSMQLRLGIAPDSAT